ncbi:MAG: NADP-dependent 3-hydroxy acid dehydrogenase YdfG [Bacteroidia bacterium]|jgi:NADP-dependent 3-hydroxy acid dehydrogenase YdfG
MQPKNKKPCVLISGGTKGIGLALVRKFVAHGFVVATCGRSEDAIDYLRKELNETSPQSLVLACDVRNKAALMHFYKQVFEHFGRLDVLINNAGVFIPGSLHEEEDGVFEVMMETNLNATYHLSRLAIPAIKKAPKPHIFNICSTASITPYLNGGSYCISKYAQYGLTKVLREELKEFNVRVTAILPGATLTASWAGTDLPTDRFIDPNSIADLIWTAYNLPASVVVEDLLVRPMQGDIE